jgi:anti-sigma-K factor RskA
MPNGRCLPHRENLAAYALGALDADDIPALEAHLADCRACRAELADYQSVTTDLLHALPPRTPPQRLRRNLIARLPSQRTRTSQLFADIFGRLPLWPVALAVTMVFLLGLNIFSALQIQHLQQGQTELAERLHQDQTAIAMLAYPSTRVLPVNADTDNLTGSMLVDEDKNMAVLVLWNLPRLDAGHTYQIWLIDSGGERLSGGLFRPLDDQGYTTATIQSPLPLGQFVGIGVTVEPEGGSQGPTGSRILGVDL